MMKFDHEKFDKFMDVVKDTKLAEITERDMANLQREVLIYAGFTGLLLFPEEQKRIKQVVAARGNVIDVLREIVAEGGEAGRAVIRAIAVGAALSPLTVLANNDLALLHRFVTLVSDTILEGSMMMADFKAHEKTKQKEK